MPFLKLLDGSLRQRFGALGAAKSDDLEFLPAQVGVGDEAEVVREAHAFGEDTTELEGAALLIEGVFVMTTLGRLDDDAPFFGLLIDWVEAGNVGLQHSLFLALPCDVSSSSRALACKRSVMRIALSCFFLIRLAFSVDYIAAGYSEGRADKRCE